MSKTDKKLLELAAKACGMTMQEALQKLGKPISLYSEWNPLTDDGDALRLAVKLKLCVATHEYVTNQHCYVEVAEESADPYAATRRAIVRAAAEIAKNKT